jgi:two-component sensor histidine kinase
VILQTQRFFGFCRIVGYKGHEQKHASQPILCESVFLLCKSGILAYKTILPFFYLVLGINFCEMPFPNIFCITALLLVTSGFLEIRAQKPVYSAAHIEKKYYADSILKAATLRNDSLQIAEAYYLLGKIELSAGNYYTSHAWFMKSLRIQEVFGDSYELGRLHIRLRDKEQRQGNYDEALQHLRIALGIFKRIKSKTGIMRVYTCLGDLYSDAGLQTASKQAKNIRFSADSALFYHKKAESLSVMLKDTIALANIRISLGRLLLSKHNPQAIAYFQNALNVFTRLKKENERISAMLFLASAYLAFNQHKKVPEILQEVQHFYEKKHLYSYTWLRNLETSYMEYYKATKQWEKAFKHLENVKELERKELLEDQKGAISRLEIEYETQKKEELLKEQHERLTLTTANVYIQQRFLVVLGALLVLTAGFGFFYYKLYRKNRQISLRNAVLIREQNHRVKNNLQLVSSLLSLQANQVTDIASKEATEDNLLRIESMAILHRKLYDKEELAIINLSDFIREIVEVVLHTFGFMHIEPHYAITEIKLNADQALPVGLIVTELVTNACKYAFPATPNPELEIECSRQKDELMLTIKDNGPGLRKNSAIDSVGSSFGTRLIQMQVTQLRGSYSFNSDKGTTFFMKFKPDFLL